MWFGCFFFWSKCRHYYCRRMYFIQQVGVDCGISFVHVVTHTVTQFCYSMTQQISIVLLARLWPKLHPLHVISGICWWSTRLNWADKDLVSFSQQDQRTHTHRQFVFGFGIFLEDQDKECISVADADVHFLGRLPLSLCVAGCLPPVCCPASMLWSGHIQK